MIFKIHIILSLATLLICIMLMFKLSAVVRAKGLTKKRQNPMATRAYATVSLILICFVPVLNLVLLLAFITQSDRLIEEELKKNYYHKGCEPND